MTRRLNRLQSLPIAVLRLIATSLEVSGDELMRLGISNEVGAGRVAWLGASALLALGDGSFLKSAPVDGGRVAGLSMTMLCILW